ncbi:MAG: hypothetical protein HZA68_05125 [Rhodovulum sp.]|nr:hypothetical protein [Rhodovulum sp.]
MNSRAPFSSISGASVTSRHSPPTSGEKAGWVPVVPVPADAPRPSAAHFKLGRPTATWTYTDAAGGVLGHVLRFDVAGGEKVFRPLVFMRRTTGEAKAEWRWESWLPPRPLYGLRQLAERPAAPVVITEGEKACDAARALLPSAVVITSPNGSSPPARMTGRRCADGMS